ncbi:MAG TPA: glutathione ABC transporter substrate-binding protein [Bacillota bacterium]|nr:glutathione ABC transporter substrate-binding protein [Bacillota bacterium]
MRKLAGIVLVLAMVGLMVTGCPQRAAEPTPEINIVVAQGADAVSLDPHKTNDLPSARVMRHIYDTLVVQDEDLAIQPGLATEWKQIDDLTWEFKLRRGVEFHNGEALKAADVKFSFDRLLNPETASPGAFILGVLESVQVVDDYTVRLRLKQPFTPILSHLAHNVSGILNQKAVEAVGAEDYGRQPVGTGPFSFVNWTTGEHIDLVRFDGYWGTKATPNTLRFRNIREGATRAIELETGAVDIAFDIEPADYERLKGLDTVQIVRHPTLTTQYIGFNLQKPPFDRVEVRRAINHAINVPEIIEHVLLNVGRKATGPISPVVWGAHPDLEGYEFNPDRARQLLAQAGLAQGFSTTIWTNDNPIRMKIAEVVQRRLADIGITVEIQVLEWGTYLADTAAGKHDMFILGWVSVTGDADYGLYSLFHSSQFGNAGNRTFYKNERVDYLLDKGRTSAVAEERLAAYKEAQELIVADAPWLFLNVGEGVQGLGKTITGFVWHPAGHHRLTGVGK